MWDWILLFLILGVTVFWYSRKQPFPEISGFFASILLLIAGVLWLATSAPRGEGNELAPAYISTIVGGFAVIYGVVKMSVTDDDVIVAPFGGILFCVGSITLLYLFPNMTMLFSIVIFVFAVRWLLFNNKYYE